MKVESLMTTPPISCNPETPLGEVARLLKTCRPDMQVEEAEQIMGTNQIHRLPVVDDQGRLVGVISLNDIARRAAADADETLEQEVAGALGTICRPRTEASVH